MENDVNLIVESLKFMILGMGVVFTFLIIMIFVLKLQTKILTKYFPQEDEKPTTWQPTVTKEVDNTTKKIAAITAAIQHHRNTKG